MDNYIRYLGNISISEADRPAYAAQALKLLQAGGLMAVEDLNLYNAHLQLLAPLKLDEHGCCTGNYYYFTGERGTWRWNTRTGTFSGTKSLYRYYETIAAAKILTALYSSTYTAVTMAGTLFRERRFIGWINFVLGTKFTNWRATQLWELLKLLHQEGSDEELNPNLDYLLTDFPLDCVDLNQLEPYLAVRHPERILDHKCFADQESTETFRDDGKLSIGLGHALFQAALERFHEAGGTLEDLKKCLYLPQKAENVPAKREMSQLLLTRYMLTPALATAMAAKEYGVEFWPLWEEIGERIPQLGRYETAKPCPPVAPVSTQELLGVKPDDLVYWWTPEHPISFSTKLTEWMDNLRMELEHVWERIPPEEFQETLLTNIDLSSARAFLAVYDEFLDRKDDPKVHLMGREDCKVKYLKLQRQMFRKSEKDLSKEEYQRLVQAAHEKGDLRMELILETICATGIRVGELKYITVEAVRAGVAEIALKGKIRTILLPHRLCHKLQKYAKKQKIASGKIFLTQDGLPVSRQYVWTRMKALCGPAGVERTKAFPHNLRSLFARSFYGSCHDVVRLADVLGHSSIETTRIYLMSTGKEYLRQLDKLGLVQ